MVCNFFARSENIQQGKNDAWRNYDKPSFLTTLCGLCDVSAVVSDGEMGV